MPLHLGLVHTRLSQSIIQRSRLKKIKKFNDSKVAASRIIKFLEQKLQVGNWSHDQEVHMQWFIYRISLWFHSCIGL